MKSDGLMCIINHPSTMVNASVYGHLDVINQMPFPAFSFSIAFLSPLMNTAHYTLSHSTSVFVASPDPTSPHPPSPDQPPFVSCSVLQAALDTPSLIMDHFLRAAQKQHKSDNVVLAY